jgi:hypothetical protein
MSDVATLGLKVDASGAIKPVEEVEKKLDDLGGTADKAGKEMSAAAKRSADDYKKLADTAGKVAAALSTGAIAALGLVIRNSAEQERVVAQLEARIKSTGAAAGLTSRELQDMAAALQRVTTFGDEAIIGMQSLLLTFTQVRGENFEAATKAVLNLAIAMDGDLKGATLQLGKALNDPVKGAAALAESGIQLTQAQKDTIATMVALGDVAGAQRVILAELETQFGGAAEAARNTLGGALKSLRNAFGDLAEVPSIVGPVTDALNGLTALVTDGGLAAAVQDMVRRVIINLAAMASAFYEVLGELSGAVARFGGLIERNFQGPLGRGFGKIAGDVGRFARDMSDGTKVVQAGIDGMLERMAQAPPTFGKVAAAATTASAAVASLAAETADAGTRIEEALTPWQKFVALMGEYEQAARKAMAASPIAPMASPQQSPIAVAAPPAEVMGAWDAFLGDLVNGWGEVTRAIGQVTSLAEVTAQSLGDSFLRTFSTIAQRGKASFADLFAFLGGAGVGGATGGAVLGGLATLVEIFTGGASRAAEARRQYLAELDAFTDGLADWGRRLGMAGASALVVALAAVDAQAKAAAAEAVRLFPTTTTISGGVGGRRDIERPENAQRLGQELVRINALRLAEIALIIAQQAATQKALNDEVSVRQLLVAGQTDAADQARLQIQHQNELNAAIKQGLDVTALRNVQEAEFAQLVAKQARDRATVIGGLDAQIARAGGDESTARQIERDIALANATDEVVRAKLRELYAIEDVNLAAQEFAKTLDAAKALARTNLGIQGEIATAQGDAAGALAIERQIRLSEATDESTKKLLLFLFAAQDAAAAAAEAAELQRQATENARTILSIDAEIARLQGDDKLAASIERQIKRDTVLATVTDEVVLAKYRELWAIEDLAAAAQEAAAAQQLLSEQIDKAGDLEVRKLIATGKSIEAEELRFQLAQARELRQAESDLAKGLIDQALFDQIKDVLGAEATAFANRGSSSEIASVTGGAGDRTRTGVGERVGVTALATAQVQDIDRVVGELSTIRIRTGQMVSLLQQLVSGGGILGAVNRGLQNETTSQQVRGGNILVA